MITEWIAWVLQRVSEHSFASFRSWDTFVAAMKNAFGVFADLEGEPAWPYLLASFTIAGAVYIWTERNGRPWAFFAFLFPRCAYFHPSAVLDYKFAATNIVLRYLLFFPLLTGIGLLAYKIMAVMWIGGLAWEPPKGLSHAQALGAAFGFFLLSDVLSYWSHVLFHKVPVLWAFHRVHHSAEALTPVTAFRAHPLELFVPIVLQMPVIGSAMVFYRDVPPSDLAITTVFGVGLFVFMCNCFGRHLQHSHVWLSFGPILSRIYISPAQHQIHHSADPRHADKNFGVRFAFWDALFGTLYVPKRRETFPLGLQEAHRFTTVCSLYVRPFVEIVPSFKPMAEVDPTSRKVIGETRVCG